MHLFNKTIEVAPDTNKGYYNDKDDAYNRVNDDYGNEFCTGRTSL